MFGCIKGFSFPRGIHICLKSFQAGPVSFLRVAKSSRPHSLHVSISTHLKLKPSWIGNTSHRGFASSTRPPMPHGNDLRNKSALYYLMSLGVAFVGFSFAAVPLYKVFCGVTGFGGTTQVASEEKDLSKMERLEDREIRIRFNADTSRGMRWKFRPKQKELYLVPGESVLAFYVAENPTDKPIIGISTYNVLPFEAGVYFNKIQCFCFEEQVLNPHETVDMPVFFYIDPEFAEDPAMQGVHEITLSYTFFEAKSQSAVAAILNSAQHLPATKSS